ncbi:hypothetical protein IWQ61_002565 [Dispira simplex]|nr:hypothetical protein IWQ61_002565 [Dispira simplex]
MALKYLGQKLAQQIDHELMSPTGGFIVEQLMELGLVAARHLHHFGYEPSIYYPKQPSKDLYTRLVKQCTNLRIPLVDFSQAQSSSFDLVVDALFGFSFSGDIRDPFKDIMDILATTMSPTVAVDVPSGWNVEQGDVHQRGYQPTMLVSLTAPKLCARSFKGKHHYLGGRFITPTLAEQYGLHLPPYPGSDQCVRLS